MNWNKTKNFLIVLFSLINIYLIIQTSSTVLNFKPTTKISKKSIDNTVNILSKNYGIEIDRNIIPINTVNLMNIDVKNIIYTSDFLKSDIDFDIEGSVFSANKSVLINSKREAENEAEKLLDNIGIRKGYYDIEFDENDYKKCKAVGKVANYIIYNNVINFEFGSKIMSVSGMWFIPQSKKVYSREKNRKMAEITSVLIEAAPEIKANNHNLISKIDYGYYVSLIDSNTVSKSASAVACYVLKTDNDSKYYYDALNGKSINR